MISLIKKVVIGFVSILLAIWFLQELNRIRKYNFEIDKLLKDHGL